MTLECCGVTFRSSNVEYCLILIYRPPNGDLDMFIDIFNEIMKELYNSYKFIIVCGDLNIDVLNTGNSCKIKAKKKFLDLLECFQLTYKNNLATRVYTDPNGLTHSSQIDYFLTNLDKDLYGECTKQLHLADHEALIFTMEQNNISNEHTIEYYKQRKINDQTLLQLQNFFERENFESVYSININVNTMYENFHNILSYALDYICPFQKIKINNTSHKRSKWITPELIDEGIKLTDIRSLSRSLNDINLKTYYNKLRNDHRKNINNSKKMYFSNKLKSIDETTDKQKEIWKIVNNETGKKNENKIYAQ